jgi:hypothetical protein
LRDADFPGFGERFAQQSICFAGALDRLQVVRFKIKGRDLGFVDEFLDLDRGGLQALLP